MMRKTHEKAGIGTIALASGFHQWKSGACFAVKALYVGTGVTFQDPNWVISSHFTADTQPPVDSCTRKRQLWLTAYNLCAVFLAWMLSTESVDKSGDNLRRKA
ncbi:MAG: hypothetical protein CMQ34_12805 [Gammaproteobacteria bacterium]|nr:hypothetical protein [Gammaproteobacteria bacterium]|tara:strand:- start:731 stop:1039 length:309 start_codon:yes stop_codon:yes gene_type:complete